MENTLIEFFKDTIIDDLKKIINDSPNGIKTFRYFLKRNYEIVNTHTVSKIFYVNNNPVGYFHIEKDNNNYWFGILISDKNAGKGYSKKIMKQAIDEAERLKIDLKLSVDKTNYIAYSLYKKSGFKLIEERQTYYLMEKKWLTH